MAPSRYGTFSRFFRVVFRFSKEEKYFWLCGSNVKGYRFQDVELEDNVAKQVSAALAKNKTVTFLRFSGNEMGDRRLGFIVPGLLENTTIRHLE